MDRPLNHDEIAGLLGAYALDAVDPEEAAAVEEHLAGCPRCRDEVAQFHQTAGVLASGGGEAPADLWDGIGARLNRPDNISEPPPRLRPGAVGDASPAAKGKSSPRLARHGGALIAVAAAVAIAILGVEVVHLDHRLNQVAAAGTGTQNLSGAAARALLDPQSRRIVLTGSGPASPVLAEVVIEGPGTAFLLNRGLPPLPAARTYQLWLTGAGRPVSAGLLGSNPQTVAFAIGSGPPTEAFAVSVEPAHGSVAPTLPPVAASPT